MTDGTELGRALRACRGAALVLVGISAAINLLGLAAPLYVMQLYDRVLASRSIDTLVMLTLAVIGATALLAALDGLRNQILARLGIWLDDRLAPPVIAARLRLAATARPQRDSEPLRDLGAIRGFLASPGIAPLMDAPWAPLFILMLGILHPLLGAIGLVSAIALLGLAVLNEVATSAALRQGGSALVRSNRLVDAACRNADAIRVMGMLDGFLRVWRREARAVRQSHFTASQRNAAVLASSRFTRLTVQSAIMGAAAWLVIDDGASPAVLFASTFLLSKALAPVENAIATWRSLVGARAAYRRLAGLLEAAPEPRAAMPLPRPEGRLTVEQAIYVPPGSDKPILRGLSLHIAPGETAGIIGPSAAGKSTLARLLAGAVPPTSGQVRLDGAEMAVWLAAEGSRHIGYLPQDVEIFCGTVRDNIARLDDAEPAAVIEAASLAGLHDMVMRLPQGYDTELGDGGVKLSGGQRQRVALARALYGDPRLVVLDEPDAALDHEGEAALLAALARLKEKGATVVIVSHRPGILNHVDKLAVMRQGVVEIVGPREQVMAKLRPAALHPRHQIAARAATPA